MLEAIITRALSLGDTTQTTRLRSLLQNWSVQLLQVTCDTPESPLFRLAFSIQLRFHMLFNSYESMTSTLFVCCFGLTCHQVGFQRCQKL